MRTVLQRQIEDLARESEARFQEIEQALVDLLDAAESLLGPDAKRKKNLQERRERLQNRRHRPKPPD